MSKHDNLEKQFEKAGLACKVLTEPIRAINADIFQADIQRGFRGNKRQEYFRIYKGHETNLVYVAGVDKRIKQLVLVVKEPEREFEQRMVLSQLETQSLLDRPRAEWKRLVENMHRGRGLKGRVVSIEEYKHKPVAYQHEQKTSSSVRHYLMGLDERQLFIAELPRAATSVAEAHRSLKGTAVTFAEGRAGGKTIRQGEWFFVEATEEEKETIQRAIKLNRISIFHDRSIGQLTGARRGGKAHIAEEAILLGAGPVLQHGFPVREREEVFVRGHISHPDHATVKLHQWRKVLKNAERGNDSNRSSSGVYWID